MRGIVKVWKVSRFLQQFSDFVFRSRSPEIVSMDPLAGHTFLYRGAHAVRTFKIEIEKLGPDRFKAHSTQYSRNRNTESSTILDKAGNLIPEESRRASVLPGGHGIFWLTPPARHRKIAVQFSGLPIAINVERQTNWRGTRSWEVRYKKGDEWFFACYDSSNGVLVGHSKLGYLAKTSLDMKMPKLI